MLKIPSETVLLYSIANWHRLKGLGVKGLFGVHYESDKDVPYAQP